MPFSLKVIRQSNSEEIFERKFDQEIMTIGRDSSNSLMLEDTRRLISRRHAKIKLEGEEYCLFDEDSRNGSFLNEQRISPGQPYTLHSGDRVKIGEYILQYTYIPAPASHEDTTVVFENPFRKEAQSLVALLRQIQKKYDPLVPNKDKAALQRAFKEALEDFEPGETEAAIAEELGMRSGKADSPLPPIPSTPMPSTPLSREASTMVRVGGVLDLFMDAVISLVKGALKFRSEFVGTTMVQQKDSLHSLSVNELKQYLFDAAISDKEARKRLGGIKNQIDESLLHQLALLDGYRGSIKEGVQELLNYLDLLQLEKEFSQKMLLLGPVKIPYRWIPFYVQLHTYFALRKRFLELLEEDRGAFDRKIFTPSFIRAYMKTMSTARQKPPADENQN